MTIHPDVKARIIGDFATHDSDTGSPEVQVALLTYRITHLTDHLKENHKDHHGRRGFLALIQRRRTLLEYLKGQEEQRYRDLIAKLGLRR